LGAFFQKNRCFLKDILLNKVAAFYQFLHLERPEAVREAFLASCKDLGLCGSVLVSPEGINGTLAGPAAGIDAFVAQLRAVGDERPAFDGLEIKYSEAGEKHFDRLKIKLKREIITFGGPLDENAQLGQRVTAGDWNALLDEPDVLLVDTRNGFEVEMGSFEGAVDPGLTSFSDFKRFVDDKLATEKHRKIAMFCTGGIRCEKASAYMIKAGFEQVFQLQGGILRYLEEVPQARSKWRGDCFVFDQRVALGHGLALKTPDLNPNSLDTARGNIAE
jgi:UPF0176 protein